MTLSTEKPPRGSCGNVTPGDDDHPCDPVPNTDGTATCSQCGWTGRVAVKPPPALPAICRCDGDPQGSCMYPACQQTEPLLIHDHAEIVRAAFTRPWGDYERAAAAALDALVAERDTLRGAILHVVNDSPGTPESVKGYLRKAL